MVVSRTLKRIVYAALFVAGLAGEGYVVGRSVTEDVPIRYFLSGNLGETNEYPVEQVSFPAGLAAIGAGGFFLYREIRDGRRNRQRNNGVRVNRTIPRDRATGFSPRNMGGF